ncbi:MAG: hypothetical protein RR135_00825, partial [Oscillospiraceae bacterium]
LTFVKRIPDVPSEPLVGWKKVANDFSKLCDKVRRHSMALFLIAIVLATMIFAIYQVTLRLSYRNATAKNTTYIGLETIGDLYLGDETI